MKLSCLPCSIFPEIISGQISLQEWVNAASAMNLDGFDFSMMFIQQHTPTYLGRVQEIIDAAGIPPVMLTTYPDFTHPDRLQRERELKYLEHDISICSQLGFKYLRVVAGQAHPQTERSQGIAYAVEGIKNAAEFADHIGVQLLYENHAKPGAWDYTDFSFPLDIFYEVLEGIKDTGVRVNYDVGNVTAFGEDAAAVLKKLIDRVETIHVTDMKSLGKQEYARIGDGVTPVKECFRILKDYGWDGWLCIEENSHQGLEGIQDAVLRTRRLWETV